jgi:hypothetical protein
LFAAGAIAPAALAQEAMYTQAATMPATGNTLLRQQFHVYESGYNPQTGDRGTRTFQSETGIQVGLDVGWSLTIKALAEQSKTDLPLPGGGSDTETDFSSVDVMAKYRFYMNNPGGVDTERAALMFGLRADMEDSVNGDPHIGVVYTRVSGRHGFNVELHYTMTTGGVEDRRDNVLGGEGTADAFNYNFAYVFRVFPDAYTAESNGAWYVTAELNGLYETNGDNEIRFSPGLMFEGRRWGFELMAQLPVQNSLDHRPELDWAVGVGVRLLF